MVDSAAQKLKGFGRRSLRICSDVTDRSSLERCLARAVAELGKVDILVNAAGRTKRTPVLDVPESEWNEIMETNLTGALRAGQVFGRHMVGAWLRANQSTSPLLRPFVGLHEVALMARANPGWLP